MLDLFSAQNGVLLILALVLFVIKAIALIDCVARDEGKFHAAASMPKRSWLVLLGLGLAVNLVSWYPLGLLNLAGTVLALVYLAQLRGSD